VTLVYLYQSLKGQISRQVDEQTKSTRVELEAARREQTELARKEAMVQLQQWREQEVESIKKQQLEVAQGGMQVQFEQWKTEYTQTIRQDAIQRSQAVSLGKITEHFVPYLPDFAYNPKDARFLGSPIDFIVFDGLNDGEVKNIVFIEVKTGNSALSGRERRICDAIQANRIQWIELRPQFETAPDSETK
jgi:predicted Holliday junction resolvase-like endonuclease